MSMIAPALFEEFGQRATVHLDAAAIATMHSAPTEIVPAPGPGKALLVIYGAAWYRAGEAVWDTDVPRVFYGGAELTQVGRSASSVFDVIQTTQTSGDNWQSIATAGDDGTNPNTLDSVIDCPLVVGNHLADPVPDVTPDGDLYVTVFYTVVDLH